MALFEHVHGDSRDRGPAMIDLGQTYEKADATHVKPAKAFAETKARPQPALP